MTSLSVSGRIIGPFRYEFVRSDDPNDIVPHDRHRDPRGLEVLLRGSITRMPKETTVSIPLKGRALTLESFTIFSILETHSEATAISPRIRDMARSSGYPRAENKLTAQ